MKLGQHTGRIHSTGAGTIKLSINNPNKTPVITNAPELSISSVQENESSLTSEQFSNIKKLKYKNGEYLVTDNYRYNNIYYEIVNRVNKFGYDKVYKFLISKMWENEEDLYFNFPEFEIPEFKYRKFLDEQFAVREVIEGLYTCKCGSKKTISFTVQLRARDEGETVFVECTACNNSWKIG